MEAHQPHFDNNPRSVSYYSCSTATEVKSQSTNKQTVKAKKNKERNTTMH
jgi:hypothetical protein